jgi:hypothetical protein
MQVFVVIGVENYIPSVAMVTAVRTTAITVAKRYADGWTNEKTSEHGEIYFNQKESANMANAVSVQEETVK